MVVSGGGRAGQVEVVQVLPERSAGRCSSSWWHYIRKKSSVVGRVGQGGGAPRETTMRPPMGCEGVGELQDAGGRPGASAHTDAILSGGVEDLAGVAGLAETIRQVVVGGITMGRLLELE